MVTEIHTGRFFGSNFHMPVDFENIGVLFLTISGNLITYFRAKVKSQIKLVKDMTTDRVIEFIVTTDQLSTESQEIHDMVEYTA
jgi:hypothetical protein